MVCSGMVCAGKTVSSLAKHGLARHVRADSWAAITHMHMLRLQAVGRAALQSNGVNPIAHIQYLLRYQLYCTNRLLNGVGHDGRTLKLRCQHCHMIGLHKWECFSGLFRAGLISSRGA